MPVVHLVNRTLFGQRPFDDPETAAFVWKALARAFPDALACCLMPNHVHLLVEVDDIEAAVRAFAAILGHVRRRLDNGPLWCDAPAPDVVGGLKKLRRVVKYVVLNPCRAELVDDPLDWMWSTHRDVVGAVAKPWVKAHDLAAALRFDRDDSVARLHAYISADSTVHPAGSALPRPAQSTAVPELPLGDVLRATCAAWRCRRAQVRRDPVIRDTFCQLAAHQGWTRTTDQARALGLHRTTLVRGRRPAPPAAIAAAALCLGDRRLLLRRRRR